MKRKLLLLCVCISLLSCNTLRLFKGGQQAIEKGAILEGVYTLANLLDSKPRYGKALKLFEENYSSALSQGENYLQQADFLNEPEKTETIAKIYEQLVKVVQKAVMLDLKGVPFPNYTQQLQTAKANAVALFLKYASQSSDYRQAHNYGKKALGYASVEQKQSVKNQMAELLYNKAMALSASSSEQTLLQALDCLLAVKNWVNSYGDTDQKIDVVKTKLAELYYSKALRLCDSTSRSQLKEAMALLEKADNYVKGYKNVATLVSELQERLTIRVFCYSPNGNGANDYWISSQRGSFNGTAVAGEFQRILQRKLINNRYIAFPNIGFGSLVTGMARYAVENRLQQEGGDFMVVVSLDLPGGQSVRKSTKDTVRTKSVPVYKASVKVDRNGVVSTVSTATISESTYNSLNGPSRNNSAFESGLRRDGVSLNKPSSGNWYYDTYKDSTSVQVTEREYLFEFDIRGRVEVIELRNGRTVFSDHELLTVKASAGSNYVSVPSSLSHLRKTNFTPRYDLEKALTDSEIETVLSRLASDVAVYLGRQT